AQALTGIFDAVSTLQRTAFQNNDKVVYGFATKLLTGELMDIKANYSKDAK
ncbi:MAG TPA: molecular chaperone GrpE, partial [Bifidobacterium sp.]|nr:molecular chaperone GrpE [Bifidobacterium sp.]